MKTIFVIGNIGAGKSTCTTQLCQAICATGATAKCADLDKLGHKALQNQKLLQDLSQEFNIKAPAISPDLSNEKNKEALQEFRKKLAKEAFSNAQKTQKLNQLTHPVIRQMLLDFIELCQQQKVNYVVIEASAITDSSTSFTALADNIVCVVADDHVRRDRAVKRGLTKHEFKKRNAKQLSSEELAKMADYIVMNNGDEEQLQQEINTLLHDLM